MQYNLLKFRRLFILYVVLVFSQQGHSQLSGNYFVPGSYPSISAAVSDLNLQGISGPVIINIQAGLIETSPAGGLVLTASGTSVNPITFQKIGPGPNPIINAYAGGLGTPGTAVQDGIWRFIGSDYVTINGIDLKDVNTTNPATMEYGYGFFKSSLTDGCQNNTIQNCIITLNTINNATGLGPAVDGSRGINVVNALASAQTTALSPTSSNGTNSTNLFYANTIINCNVGIALIGFAATSPFTLADIGNDIGGVTAVTGNKILNFGGALGATNPAAGIRTLAQYNCNVSYNQLNNNTGSGTNHVNALRGIYMNTATSANVTITNNFITLNSAAIGAQVAAIENVAGATAANNTITITDNNIDNCSNLLNTTGSFYGIYNNSANASYLSIQNNSFSNISTKANTGTNYLIYNTGAVTNAINLNTNSFMTCSNTASTTGSYFVLNNNAISTAAYRANGNVINAISTNASQGSTQLIYNAGNTDNTVSMNNNVISNCTHSISSTGAYYALYNNGISFANLTMNGNSFSNHVVTAFNGPVHLLYNTRSIGNSISFTNNLISASSFSFVNSGSFYGIYNNAGSTNTLLVNNNAFTGINSAVTSGSLHLIFNRGVITNTYLSQSFNSNLISNCNFSANAGGPFIGVYNSGVSSNLLSMSGNTINSSGWISTSSARYFIYNSGQSNTTSDLSNNMFVSCSNTMNTTGTLNCLLNTGATTLA